MERFQDPERLAALFARCRIPERLPWTAAYPWTLQYYEKGEYLCRLREPMESLYLLLEGGHPDQPDPTPPAAPGWWPPPSRGSWWAAT